MDTRYTLRGDDDDHVYLVTVGEAKRFEELLREMNEFEYDSEERWDLEDAFEKEFGSKRLNKHPNCLTFTDPKIS